MTKASTRSVSVIVCAYTVERLDLIRENLHAIDRQLSANDELIVVIDNSPDLAEIVRAEFSHLTVVENDAGRGLSSARNTGVKYAQAEILAFVDDDAIAQPHWLESLRSQFTDPDVVGVSGQTRPHWQQGQPGWFPAEFGWVVGCDFRGLPPDGSEVRNPIGANMAFRRSALEGIGGFSDELGRVGTGTAGCEETDLSIRIREHTSGKIIRATSAVVDHTVPADRSTFRYFVNRCWNEGRSKAVLTMLVGQSAGLSSERTHLIRTLPRGIVSSSTSQALAIIAGTAITVAGFVSGKLIASKVTALDAPAPEVASPEATIRMSPTVVRGSAEDSSHPNPNAVFCPIELVDLELNDGGAASASPNDLGQLAVLALDRGWPVGYLLLDGIKPGDDLRAMTLNALPADAQAPESWPESWASDREAELVTVVIATLGRRKELRETVNAVLAQTHSHIELLVVDNDPDAAQVAQILSGISDPRLRIISCQTRGTSAARNTGLWAAQGTVTAFTDDDAVPDPTWIERLHNTFAVSRPYGESRLAAVTGMVIPTGFETKTQLHFESAAGYGRGFVPSFWSARTTADPLSGLARRGLQGAAFPYAGTEYGSGNNMGFRTEALRRIGGYDTRLGPGTPSESAEDLDLLRTLYLAGETIAYAPHAIVRHHHRRTDDSLIEQLRGYGIGMGASLTKLVFSSPYHCVGLLAKLPGSFQVLFSPTSAKNSSRTPDFPRAAQRAELLGYFRGPWRYLRSRW